MKISWIIFFILRIVLTLGVLIIPIVEKTSGFNLKKLWDSNHFYMIFVIVVVCLSILLDVYNGLEDKSKSKENKEFQEEIKSQSLEISNLKGQNNQLINSNETLRQMILLNSEVDNKIKNVSFTIKLKKPFDESLNNFYCLIWIECNDYRELSLRQFIRLSCGKSSTGQIFPSIQQIDLNTPEGQKLRTVDSFDFTVPSHLLNCEFLINHDNLKMRDFNRSRVNFFACPGFMENIESVYFIVNNYVVFSKNITTLPFSEIDIKRVPSWNNYPLKETVFTKFNEDPDYDLFWKSWRIDLFSHPLQRFN